MTDALIRPPAEEKECSRSPRTIRWQRLNTPLCTLLFTPIHPIGIAKPFTSPSVTSRNVRPAMKNGMLSKWFILIHRFFLLLYSYFFPLMSLAGLLSLTKKKTTSPARSTSKRKQESIGECIGRSIQRERELRDLKFQLKITDKDQRNGIEPDGHLLVTGTPLATRGGIKWCWTITACSSNSSS